MNIRQSINAVYVRQSVDKRDSISIQSQIEACLTENQNSEYKIYIDHGFSGSNTQRPGYISMMNDIRSGLIKGVIVYRLDRLSRSVADFSRMWDIFDAHGVTFTSVNEKFDSSTPIGKAMIYIIMTFAQLERETIAERISDNYRSRLSTGSWPGGKGPFGFKNHKIQINGKLSATLVPDNNAPHAKYIFEKYAWSDCSLSDICKQLQLDNIFPSSRKAWDNVSLSRILHSPVYVCADKSILEFYIRKGISIFSNSPDEFDGTSSAIVTGKRKKGKYTPVSQHCLSLTNFPGIVDAETWLKCQEKLSQNKTTASSPSRKHTWLTGLLKCSQCGYSMVVKENNYGFYLCCSGRYNLHLCNQKTIPVDINKLETAVETQLESHLKDNYSKTPPPELIQYDKEIQKIETEIEELLLAATHFSPTTAAYIDRKIMSLEEKKAIVLEKKDNLKKKKSTYSILDIFRKLNNEEKYNIASLYIEKILISDKNFEIIRKQSTTRIS